MLLIRRVAPPRVSSWVLNIKTAPPSPEALFRRNIASSPNEALALSPMKRAPLFPPAMLSRKKARAPGYLRIRQDEQGTSIIPGVVVVERGIAHQRYVGGAIDQHSAPFVSDPVGKQDISRPMYMRILDVHSTLKPIDRVVGEQGAVRPRGMRALDEQGAPAIASAVVCERGRFAPPRSVRIPDEKSAAVITSDVVRE